ncbi:cell wall hydrolase [Sphingomonas sp.]|uniref:cell wall hydrolase n=1 Tax=Sphingomonas sp. TaxID=28214 RepID=UPI002B5A1B00|nr:cell wall hydrolase [Sphingomonas sp.]HWK35955.1 cell wall hydrolase [Sphingomonas sp.]
MTVTPSLPQPRWLIVVSALIAVLAIAVPAWLVAHAPPVTPVVSRVVRPHRIVPKAELPPVEPITFQNLAPTDAREFNATVPFSTAPNPAARPFRLYGSAEDQARAVDCLAAGVIYEAGDDATGEKAVAQVILNRVRHPAFPNSVCGVVFQGSERKTGCQFTFTCDGAMMRPVRAAAWDRARAIALAALNGEVDKRVGHATHYHTDWVVPYWSASLDKITEIHTHLFFRWTGWWGTPPAFASRYLGAEPNIPQLARLSPAHHSGDAAGTALLAGDGAPLLPGAVAIPKGLEQDENAFLVTLDPALGPEMFPALAAKACGDRPYCKFMAWTSKGTTPTALPVSPVQQRAMSFSYLRDRAFGFEKALWNCAEFKRAETGQCMKSQVSISMAPPPPASFTYDSTPGSALRAIAGATAATPAPPPVVPTRAPLGPDPLTGLRRKTDAKVPMDAVDKPAAAPTPPMTTKAEPARE